MVSKRAGFAEEEARLEERGAHRHVAARLVEAFLDGAGRMADLLAEIPKHVKNRLDDGLTAPGRVVGQQEKQVDVGSGRQGRAAVAADRGDDAACCGGGVGRRMNVGHDVMMDRLDQFVFDLRELAGADEPAAIVLERLAREIPAMLEGVAEKRQRLGARRLDGAPARMQRRDVRAQPGAIEQLRRRDRSAAPPRGNCFEHGVKASDWA